MGNLEVGMVEGWDWFWGWFDYYELFSSLLATS
jgi:hypothetical protein